MSSPDSTLRNAASRSGSDRARPPSITPVFPLILLETMRDRDRPEEVLEDEDLTVSMPRRLGLSDVILGQIHRLQEEVKAKRLQSPPQVMDLMRLVVRRPDAEAIFAEAGRRVAQHQWARRSAPFRGTLRVLPNAVRRASARRAARRLFRQLAGDGRLWVGRWPVEIRLHDPLSARADPSGAACAFFGGAFGELMELHTGRRYQIRHPRCATRGEDVCEWSVEVSG